jgi:threonine dehydrogenase-like Zn-dependent dehydrogenase
MKAAQYYGPGDVRIEEIAEPQPKEGQVKIKIAWNGICGSDLHAYLAPMPKFPTKDEAIELSGEKLPITLGHEISGTIVELGPGLPARKWKVGQNVVVEPIISCLKIDTCRECAAGNANICPEANCIGIGGWGGGLSEYIATDVKYVHVLPDGVPLDVGACMEPLAVAWYAVKRSGFKKSQTVLIVGAGPIGLFLLIVLRSIDPSSNVIVSEPASRRRELAVAHGATHVLDPTGISAEAIAAEVQKANNGLGVDFVFDAAGIQAGLDAGLMSLRPRGVFINVAGWERSPRVDMNMILIREITLTGTVCYNGIHPEMLAAVASGQIKGVSDLITRKISLDDLVQDGLLALLHQKDSHVKILVHP